MDQKFYITSTLPYTNSNPHIGFALEIIQTDVIARYQRALGKEVFFNTGADEHGLKIYRKALEEGKDSQEYVDQYAAKFKKLKEALNLSFDNFIRTTDEHHLQAAQEFWRLCDQRGDIYKKNYKIKYCLGCELEKTESELAAGKCLFHPNLELEIIEEENYFFRFSKYQSRLLKFYEDNSDFVLPRFRFNEIKQFVQRGLNDFSISRLKSKLPWGVPVPSDPEQTMFVWFDALVGYISALGWPNDKEKFSLYWPGVQTAGKDNLRQQSAIWQAMLMSAGLPNSKQILIHGFINVEGQKISKSLGNVIDPFELVKKYGVDPVRYYLLREIPSNEDGDFSYKKLEARYNGDLANNLGNLVSRTAKLIETKLNGELIFDQKFLDKEIEAKIEQTRQEVDTAINEFKLHEALAKIWELLTFVNVYLDEHKPWADVQEHPDHFLKTITSVTKLLLEATKLIEPFLPQTAEKIYKIFEVDPSVKDWEGFHLIRVTNFEPLFPKLK